MQRLQSYDMSYKYNERHLAEFYEIVKTVQ